MGRTPELSIIIPSFKRADLLYYGLRSIREQLIERDIEIIVLNDGILDATEDVCNKFGAHHIFTGHRNLANLKWRCPGYAINIGVKQSLGSVLLLTVPEIYLNSRDVVEKLYQEIKQHPSCMAIPKGYDDINSSFLRHIKNNGNFENYPLKQTLVNLHTDYPFCLALSKYRFLEVGGYDEDFTGWGYDDTDFVLRLKNSGSEYHRLYDLSVVHLYHERSRVGITNHQEMLEYNKNLYLTRNGVIQRNVGREWGILGD